MTTSKRLIKIRWRSNIRKHIEWFEFLDSDKFFQDIKGRYENKRNLQELQRIGRQVVEEEIYSYANYQGDGKIQESVTPFSSGNDSAHVGIFFNPAIAEAKGPVDSGSPSQFNYAAFFEDPNFNSFLPPGTGQEVMHPRKFRPFQQPLTDAGNEFAIRQSMQAILKATMSKRPRQPKETP